MKKIVSFLLALLMVGMFLGLNGCGSAQTAATTQAAGATKPAEPAATAKPQATTAKRTGDINGDGKIIVGYLAKNTVDAFHSTLNSTAKTKLDALVANKTIDDWKLLDGKSDPITQCNLLDDALNMGADLIILLPAEAAGSAPILTKCKEKGVPCIVVNSKTENTDDLATAFVGSDDVQAGEMMAQFVQKTYPDGGSYAHIQGVIGNSAQIDRSKGIHNILDKDTKWKMLDEQTGEWQAEKAVKFAEDWLSRFGSKLTCIICEDDGSSAAVQTAMNAKGRKDMVCIGINGEAMALDMIKKGEMKATVYQDGAGQVSKGIDLAVDVINGKTVNKKNMIDFVMITKDNVDQYIKK